jgi:membrane protein implicated in regulation of membrane protease activity
MVLTGALLALFATGFWLYCLADAILTPGRECRALSKPAWIAVIAVTFLAGALAWLIVRRTRRDSYRLRQPVPRWDAGHDFLAGQHWTAADDAAARHPVGRARARGPRALAQGPDDDPEFLRALNKAIHGNQQADPEA